MAEKTPNGGTDPALTEAISKLSDVAERLASAPAAGVAAVAAPAELLAQRQRLSQNGKVFGAFVAGVLLAALVIPQTVDDGDDGASVAATSPGAPLSGAPVASGGATDPGTGVAGGAPSAGGGTVSATPGSPAGATTPGAPAAGSGGAATVARGQSGPGVTDKQITVGVVDLDSSDLATVCPRCGNGPASTGAAQEALLEAWRRDGRLPVNGRDIKLERRKTTVLDTTARRAACVEMAQQVKPAVVIVNPVGTFDVAECMAKEFKLLTVGIDTPDEVLLAQVPTLYSPAGTTERTLRNFVFWADGLGLFKGQKIGLYYQADGVNVNSDILNRSLKPALTQKGYKVDVEVTAEGESATSTTPLAVQRFSAEQVTTVILLFDNLAFQQAADAQGYKPKYPSMDIGYTFVDAVADISFDPDQMDGNLGMRLKYWDWQQRKPAVPKGNPAAAYCIKEYAAKTKRTLDVFEHGAEIQYVVESCTTLEVLMKGLENAGPFVSQQTIAGGLQAIRGLQTAELLSVTFGPNRRGGTDMQGTYIHHKERDPLTNEYFRPAPPGWQKIFVD